MNGYGEESRHPNQVILGILAALVSVAVVFGSLLLVFGEDRVAQAFVRTPTHTVSGVVITSIPTSKPGQLAPTITRTPTLTLNTPACAYPSGWVAYSVQGEDTLANLALAYGVSLDTLLRANCLLTSGLLPGMLLYVPPPPVEQPTDTPQLEPSDSLTPCGPPPGWVAYRVRSGDYLIALANVTGTTVAQIMEANCMVASKILAGQTLYLPYMPPTSTAEPTATEVAPTRSATAQLSLVKTANTANYDQSGDSLSYSYRLENVGNVPLSGPFSVTDNKTSVNCPSTANLAPGANLICSGNYSVTQADLDSGNVTNSATARGFYNGNTVNSNSASQTVNAVQSPSLNLDKTSTSSNYSALSDNLPYSYQLSNSGNVTLSGPFSVSDNKASVNCPSTGSLAPGASITCVGSYSVTQADLDAGSVTNTATAQGFFGGNPVTSKADSVTISANQNPALALTKTASRNSFTAAGDSITYSYEVRNSGNVTLQGPFSVTDDKATVNCLSPGSLAPGGTISCSATYLVTTADVTAGQVTNTASASATFGGSSVSSSSVTVTVNGP